MAVEAAMSWDTYYQRKSVIEAVLAEVAETRTGEIPVSWHTEITEVFGGVDEFLLAVHYRWSNTLCARLDALLESPPQDTGAKVRQIWQALAAEQPATVSLLARYADRPPLVTAMRHQQRQLAWALGVDVAELTQSGVEPAGAAA
jgi:hypothetical protein